MKVTEIYVSYGATLNVGNYNSARMDLGLRVSLEEGDDADAVREQLIEKTRAAVRKEAQRLIDAGRKEVAAVLAGLPVEAQLQITGKDSK
mgnify:CR=1 FL=1